MAAAGPRLRKHRQAHNAAMDFGALPGVEGAIFAPVIRSLIEYSDTRPLTPRFARVSFSVPSSADRSPCLLPGGASPSFR
jgi:hypothetical protein